MFIFINELLLENKQLTSDEKIVLCMLNAFKKAGASYWGSYQYMADKCGLSVDIIRAAITKFIEFDFIIEDNRGLSLKDDLEKLDFDLGAPWTYKFDEKKFLEKLNELRNEGYQTIAETGRYIQLTHPDKPGLVLLNK